MAISGQLLGTDLCRILEIDPENVTSVTVKCVAGEPAQVVVIRHIGSPDEADSVRKIIKRYRLEQKP